MCNLSWVTCILPPGVVLILIEGDEGSGTGDVNIRYCGMQLRELGGGEWGQGGAPG